MNLDLLRQYAHVQKPRKSVAAQAVLDSVADDAPTLDSAANDYALSEAAHEGAGIIQAWAEVNDLAEGENFADVLQDMIYEDADMNDDGELSESEIAIAEAKLNAAYDYLVSKGAAEEDAYKLLTEWNADAAERVHDLILAKLPDGDEAEADIENFVFGSEGEEAVVDSVHKKTWAIRAGKKVRINKKISGAKNARRVALARKNARKMHSAKALLKRLKSMRIRRARGL